MTMECAKNSTVAPLFALLALVSATAWSQAPAGPGGSGSPGGGGGGEHRGPPPEALAACKSLASGAACSFTTERGARSGTCWAPEGKPLACKPAGGSPKGAPPAQ